MDDRAPHGDEPSLTLGEQIRQLRVMRSESLRSVGDATGYSSAYLLKVEKDDVRAPSPHLLAALARHFSVSYERLMQLAGYQVSDQPAPSERLSLLAEAISKADLTREEQEAVAAFVSTLQARRR